jgi:hypothetical protein
MPGQIEYEEASKEAEVPEEQPEPAPGPLKCPYCTSTYAKQEDLDNHLLIWHGINVKAPPATSNPPQGGAPVVS